ncbi:uncharacterized protein LOC121975316 [Zingiber officinale]|uniref:uncharacterized protein LOC121975316 n=1 Tax=Zingiber officinale TaxID=94328 RepID=UPI001C4B64F7|nr:uncharacterized protein LOC121975316 [Zingiber officinale]
MSAYISRNVLRSREWSHRLPPIRCVLFHSSPTSLSRRSSDRSDSENKIRFSVRLKRSDARTAVRNICLNGTSSKQYIQGEDIGWFGNRKGSRNFKLQDNMGESNKNQRPKSKDKSKYQRVSDCWKSKHDKNRHRQRGQNFDDDDDGGYEHHSTKFNRFGGQRSFTWSFNSDEKLHFNNFCGGFEWRDCSQKAKSRTRIWNESDLEEEEEESIDVRLQSHRRVLELPLTGPLTLDAIKSAFHAHALKWHPDKHGGPSQVIAEEKFKVCVDAYNTLRNALK